MISRALWSLRDRVMGIAGKIQDPYRLRAGWSRVTRSIETACSR
jgi:hypothetical protein